MAILNERKLRAQQAGYGAGFGPVLLCLALPPAQLKIARNAARIELTFPERIQA
jgi:hypothetical protein